MKKIEAIIRPEKLELVKEELHRIGIYGITVIDVEGHGKQRGITQQWRGETYTMEFIPKIKLEIFVKDIDLERVISCILQNAKTGEIGDGKIFVLDVKDAIRIRTGERGNDAI